FRLPGPRGALVHQLDGDAAIELRIPGRVDDSHRAGAENAPDQVPADQRPAADGKIQLHRARRPLADLFGVAARGDRLRCGGQEPPATGASVEVNVRGL